MKQSKVQQNKEKKEKKKEKEDEMEVAKETPSVATAQPAEPPVKRKRKRKHGGSKKAGAPAPAATASQPPPPSVTATTSSSSSSSSPTSSTSSSSSASASSSAAAVKRKNREDKGEGKKALKHEPPHPKRQRTLPSKKEEEKSSTQPVTKEEKAPAKQADEDLEVTVVGAPNIAPVDTFTECAAFNVHGGALLKNIEKNEYKKPTPVQQHALPILLAGRDLMGRAQTGSGKTAAFLLPIIASLLSEDKRKGEPPGVGWRHTYRAYPLVIILAPTRELAIQIYEEAVKFAESTPVKAAMVYGGTSYVAQSRLLEKNGSDILVATPGRLKDMIERDKISLRQVCYLVLDEADRMLDMGFEPDIRDLVEQRDMPKERHTMMFSATFPAAIKKLATDFLKKDFVTLTVGREGATTEAIKQIIKQVHNENHKWNMLKEEIQQMKEGQQVLVFVELKHQVAEVGQYLQHAGFSVAMIHGDMEQREREQSLKSFRKKLAQILVGTDVAGRGLDIEDVNHVINFAMPKNIESYVHRIGRTGRAGQTGMATTFFTPGTDRDRAPDLVEMLKASNQEVPNWLKSIASQPKNKKQRSKEKFNAVRKQRKQMFKQNKTGSRS